MLAEQMMLASQFIHMDWYFTPSRQGKKKYLMEETTFSPMDAEVVYGMCCVTKA